MSAYAALRTGSGLSNIALNERYLPLFYHLYPELVLRLFKRSSDVESLLIKKDAICFGPGLGRTDDVNESILKMLLKKEIPLIIDADGLFYLKKYMNDINKNQSIIVTPHIGEMAMLLDIGVDEVNNDPIKAIHQLTKKGLIVVLKGPCTIIANNETIYFSNGGNPGMATAGSGDVLSGIILSLVGQRISPLEASVLGVVLHSASAYLAREKLGEASMIATDIINYLPKVLRGVHEE